MSLPSTCIDIWRRLAVLVALGLPLAAAAQTGDVEKALMPGAVITGHAKYEQQCEKCHKRFDKAAQTTLCLDCHKDTAADIRAKTRLHGHLDDVTCRNCHTDHKGRGAAIAVVDKNKFDHNHTNFRLRGAHKETKQGCDSCHAKGKKYRDAPTECYACHKKDDDEKGHRGGLGKKCEDCHDDAKWKDTHFDHDTKTKFKLAGKHKDTKCKECHIDGRYKDTPKDCYSCHKKDDNEKEGGHRGKFGTKCDKCHSADQWKEAIFDHDRDTKYRLKGRHQKTKCVECHKGQIYVEKLPTKCISCHRKDDDEKGHRGSLGDKCESCHDESGWKKTSFDHDKDTKYPLEGKHRTAKCESCHKSGLKPLPGTKTLEKLPTKCFECHRKDDNEKGHKGKFGEKCETCHNAKDWKKAIFDHDRDTKYLLKGKHRDTKCATCHTGQLYVQKLTADCISCHRKNDQEKGHKGQLGEKCETCHNERDWKVEKFDHNRSRFPLVSSHARVECKKCHLTSAFREAPRECNGCHEKDDVHKRAFGIKCEICHSARTWKTWDFDHDKTKFRLDGGHKKVECYGCHKVPEKMPPGREPAPAVSRTCIGCHQRQDVHDGGFGVQCEACHFTDNWKKIKR
ncbi:MAG TPA: cytochrome c3 family protein [Rhodocyclaceae bacterium]|nr:cytochrome c3 family protein [Rhodocyclaceae bacterium]